MNIGEIVEHGAWSVGANEEDDKVFIQSDDFTHNVRLYVNGNFQNHEQCLAYANEIAMRLNAWPSLSRFIKESEDHKACVEASIKHGAGMASIKL